MLPVGGDVLLLVGVVVISLVEGLIPPLFVKLPRLIKLVYLSIKLPRKFT